MFSDSSKKVLCLFIFYMSQSSYQEEKADWRKLEDTGLRKESDIHGLPKGALTFLGYLEQTENHYFKSKQVSNKTNGTVSQREISSGLAQVKNDLDLEQEEFDKWYWGSPGGSAFDAEKIRDCLSEKADYTFSWD